MSDAFSTDLEAMLQQAFAPVEPPERLIERLESTLTDLAGMAAEELENWELSAMHDPRNWVRPVAAAALGTAAGAGLVALRMRRNHKRRVAAADTPADFAEETMKAIVTEARRLLDR
ncbi:MAG: hypothetical protein V9E83_01955 [Baekduia sp.]